MVQQLAADGIGCWGRPIPVLDQAQMAAELVRLPHTVVGSARVAIPILQPRLLLYGCLLASSDQKGEVLFRVIYLSRAYSPKPW